ncbi:MAG: ComEA family DNA-binding protein, partial [Saprospiraceae bacterium]
MRITLSHYVICCLLLLSVNTMGQTDSLQGPADYIQENLIENFAEGAEEDAEFDFDTAFEFPFSRKVDINKASRTKLQEFGLLSEIQINQLIDHREEFGDLIAIYELQSIPSFDLQTIQRIRPFISVSGGIDDYNLSLKQMLKNGRNELYLRWVRVLEDQRGYLSPEEGGSENGYLGDQNKYYARYRHSYENKLSFGFTVEKDAGEEFFKGSNKQGFDFFSAHLYLRDYSRRFKAIALGDFRVAMGQGLIRFNGFASRKSPLVTATKRGGRTIDRYSSVNEINFMRGAGVTIGLTDNLDISAFASYRQRDANILTGDSISIDDAFEFSSLQSSGFHRTATEIADKNQLNNTTFGGVLKYTNRKGHLALNVLYDRFDKSLNRALQPYNRFFFNGDRLLNASFDYNYRFQNLYFFGETAWSDNNRFATLNGLLLTLDRWVDLAVLQRSFQKDYQAILAQLFAETTGGRNEEGLYLGLEIRPAKHWKIQTYFDTYKHPWLRFNADAPSKGYDFLSRVTFWQKRKLDAYIQFRTEKKQVNNTATDDNIDPLANLQVTKIRAHLSQKISKTLTLRSRIFWGYAKLGSQPTDFGYGGYQDVVYSPTGSPLSFSARYAIFNTDSYAIRFYHYENDVLFSFSIPAYYNRG